MHFSRLTNWIRALGQRTGPGRIADSVSTEAFVTIAEPPLVATPAPPQFRGFINELSPLHIEGWLQNLDEMDARVAYEALIPESQEVLAQGVADQFRHGMHASGIGDGAHAFQSRWPRPLTDVELSQVIVRPRGDSLSLPRSPNLKPDFEPVLHVAMDIVDNCNLRCPFCLYDYANTHKTNFMSDATIDAALRFLPFTRDGEFWFSCLHEPTLHPKFVDFLAKVPTEYRHKIFYTSNLAKRMPAHYYAWLADSGLHHINISIESLQPALYERMRKGARHRIFMESWDALLAAFATGKAPPRIRYITMVYKSNLAELPELVRYLLEQRNADNIELRYTFDVPYIPPQFRQDEFLTPQEWLDLRDQLAVFPADRVNVTMPPGIEQAVSMEQIVDPTVEPPPPRLLPDYYMFRMSWDGGFRVVGVRADSRNDHAVEVEMMAAQIRDIDDPLAFINQLRREN